MSVPHPRVPCWDGKTQMACVFNDGGRAAAGFERTGADCVCRSMAIAMQQPYAVIHAALTEIAKTERSSKGRKRSNASTGFRRDTSRRFLLANGWRWVPTMGIGTGSRVTLCEEDLPMGRLIVAVSRHFTAVIDRVIHDIYDPQRAGLVSEAGKPDRISRRCVYGYFIKEEKSS